MPYRNKAKTAEHKAGHNPRLKIAFVYVPSPKLELITAESPYIRHFPNITKPAKTSIGGKKDSSLAIGKQSVFINIKTGTCFEEKKLLRIKNWYGKKKENRNNSFFDLHILYYTKGFLQAWKTAVKNLEKYPDENEVNPVSVAKAMYPAVPYTSSIKAPDIHMATCYILKKNVIMAGKMIFFLPFFL